MYFYFAESSPDSQTEIYPELGISVSGPAERSHDCRTPKKRKRLNTVGCLTHLLLYGHSSSGL